MASEPDIASPVAVAWDENGRLFVVEMTDYPAGPGFRQASRAGGPRPRRPLRGCQDVCRGLNFPNGVLPGPVAYWSRRLLTSCSSRTTTAMGWPTSGGSSSPGLSRATSNCASTA